MMQTVDLQRNQLCNQQGCLLSAGGIVVMYMQMMSPDTATPAPHKAPTAAPLSTATLQPETYPSLVAHSQLGQASHTSTAHH